MHPAPRPLNLASLQHLLLPRERDSHKGNFGHVLVVGGNTGFGGAALMAAEAAVRAGAGLVSVATHPAHINAFLARCPELMVKGIENPDVINAFFPHITVLVLGPGLGQSDWSLACARTALAQARQHHIPVVLDADGLNLLARGLLECTGIEKNKLILTPHPGEATRLLEHTSPGLAATIEARDKPASGGLQTAAEKSASRTATALALQQQYGGVIVLKGAGTLICQENEERLQLDCCQHGNPGMASGGMGDVLSGILGALLAQGFNAGDAARLGVCLHGQAADLEAASHGERGMLATDLLPQLRTLLNP